MMAESSLPPADILRISDRRWAGGRGERTMSAIHIQVSWLIRRWTPPHAPLKLAVIECSAASFTSILGQLLTLFDQSIASCKHSGKHKYWPC